MDPGTRKDQIKIGILLSDCKSNDFGIPVVLGLRTRLSDLYVYVVFVAPSSEL